MTENVSLSPGSMRTILITTFALALLGLVLGLHNVREGNHLSGSQLQLSEAYARTNAARRLTALEAERDAMREQVDALQKQIDGLAAAPEITAP